MRQPFILCLLLLLGCPHSPADRGSAPGSVTLRASDIPQRLVDARRLNTLHDYDGAIVLLTAILNHLEHEEPRRELLFVTAMTEIAEAYCRSGARDSCVTSLDLAYKLIKSPSLQAAARSYWVMDRLAHLCDYVRYPKCLDELHELAYETTARQNGREYLDTELMAYSCKKREYSIQDKMALLTRIDRRLFDCNVVSVNADCYSWSHGLGMENGILNETYHRLLNVIPVQILISKNLQQSERKKMIEIFSQQLKMSINHWDGSHKLRLQEHLGDLYHQQGDSKKAQDTYEGILADAHLLYESWYHAGISQETVRSMGIVRNSIVQDVSKKLAHLSASQGYYSKAIDYYRAAITAMLPPKDSGAVEFWHVAETLPLLKKLAPALWLDNRIGHAIVTWNDAMDIAAEQFNRASSFENEYRLINLAGELREISSFILNMFLRNSQAEERDMLMWTALSGIFLSQSRVADVMADHMATVSTPRSEQERVLLHMYRVHAWKLAALETQKWPTDREKILREEYEDISRKLIRLETQINIVLGKKFNPQNRVISKEFANYVFRELPRGSSLINYVKFPVCDPFAPVCGLESKFRYMAFILRPSQGLSAIDLGDAADIDAEVHQLHAALSQPGVDYSGRAASLHARLVQPLRDSLSAVQRLFLVPDGELHLLPFEVLSDGGRPLGEAYEISYLSSGRDLLRTNKAESFGDVVVFANPDIHDNGLQAGALAAGNPTAELSPHDPVAQLEQTRSLSLRRSAARIGDVDWGKLPPLPGAEAEAQTIQRQMPYARVYLGSAATEQALFGLDHAPTILHLATHALFFGTEAEPGGSEGRTAPASSKPESPVPNSQPRSALAPVGTEHGLGRPDSTGQGLVPAPDGEPANPLVRSALVLAGAAHGRARPDSPYDGLATALEIATTLRLSGTKLVVLAACETARGVIWQGEGVAGLRRAFLVAGAESVIATLWPVSDGVTQQLMNLFYAHLREGQPRSDALRLAKAAIRAQPGHAHPFYWAGFILLGQDGPISGIAD